jgi:hypothetical protein
MGTFYSGGDDDVPTIEEILYTALQKKGFPTADQGADNIILGVKEVPETFEKPSAQCLLTHSSVHPAHPSSMS